MFFNHKDVSTEVWYKNGVIYRDEDKPARIKYFGDKTINSYSFYKDGILDRDKGPALVSYYFLEHGTLTDIFTDD